ncbi:hypothetical protein [Nocardioides pacificus]
MLPLVQARMRANSGLITYGQALEAGLAPDQVLALVRGRDSAWVRVRRGVYVERSVWEALDEYVGRRRLESRAAHLSMVTDHVLSHDSAALELGLTLLRPERPLVHITRPDVRGSRTEHGIKHHGAVHRPDQVMVPDGIACLDVARTAVDLGREHGYRTGLVACDSALRLGVTRGQLRAALEPMRCWPGVTASRAAVERADAGAESAGETLTRDLLDELGLGPVQTQFELRDATGWARCDLRVGRHVFEFDGWVKYHRSDVGGLADRPIEQVVWEEKRREDWVRSFGLGMSRLVWADLWGAQRERTKTRLLREHALTEARFGSSIDDLAHLVVRRVA